MQTVNDVEKIRCTGCGACRNICASRSITMKIDDDGFLYPSVNISTCSYCGNCLKRCPVIYPPAINENQKEPQVYAAWSLDQETRFNSTSGGIFTELAKVVISQKGYVIGAKYNEKFLVEHAMIDNMEDITILRQSKYVQSETKDIYKKVKVALHTEKPVLFVGTPCQCAGLLSYLREPYSNLIVCDFICRGVNSPKIYQTYLAELESKYGSAIKKVWFKNKTFGWNKFCTKIIFKDGKEYHGGRDSDPFMYGYIKSELNLYMRPSCGHCKFKGIRRTTDITLGDFWGVKLKDSSDNMENGVSVVMIHTQKGMNLFEALYGKVYCEEKQIEEIVQGNKCLQSSVVVTNKSTEFYSLLRKNISFTEAVTSVSQK